MSNDGDFSFLAVEAQDGIELYLRDKNRDPVANIFYRADSNKVYINVEGCDLELSCAPVQKINIIGDLFVNGERIGPPQGAQFNKRR